jgi:hypothetical protein
MGVSLFIVLANMCKIHTKCPVSLSLSLSLSIVQDAVARCHAETTEVHPHSPGDWETQTGVPQGGLW